jgi:hypothetical protein
MYADGMTGLMTSVTASFTDYDTTQGFGDMSVTVGKTQIALSWTTMVWVYSIQVSGVRCNVLPVSANGTLTVTLHLDDPCYGVSTLGTAEVAIFIPDPITFSRQGDYSYMTSKSVVKGMTTLRISEADNFPNAFETQSLRGTANDATQLILIIQGLPPGALLENAFVANTTSQTVAAAVSPDYVFPQSGSPILVPIDIFSQDPSRVESIDVTLAFGMADGIDQVSASVVSAAVTLGPEASSDDNLPFDPAPGSNIGGDRYANSPEPPVAVLEITDMPASLVDFVLSAGSDGIFKTTDSDRGTHVGYGALAVNSPYATAVLSYEQNGVTITEAGIPASPPTTSSLTFIEYRSGVVAVPGNVSSGAVDINTGVAVVNTGSSAANVTYTLRDLNGFTLSVGHGTIPQGNHFAKFINELEEVASDFTFPDDFQNVNQFGTLQIDSDQPVSVLAMRGTTNQRNEFLITTTPVADLVHTGPNALNFPQLVDGNGYTTSLILLNGSSSNENGTLQVRDNNGNPLSITPAGGTPATSFTYSIPVGGAFVLQTDGSPANLNVGWVEIQPEFFSSTPVGLGVFRYNPAGILISESGIPAAASSTHVRVYVDLTANHDTGLAISNLMGTASNITINAFQNDGSTPAGSGPASLQLTPYGHTAQFADQFLSGLPAGFTGVLDISSTTPFAALSLRSLVNERGDFLTTIFPVADFNRAAPQPGVFPQIANGGGYTTEFVLMNTIKELDSVLCLYNEDGTPWFF